MRNKKFENFLKTFSFFENFFCFENFLFFEDFFFFLKTFSFSLKTCFNKSFREQYIRRNSFDIKISESDVNAFIGLSVKQIMAFSVSRIKTLTVLNHKIVRKCLIIALIKKLIPG